MIHDIDIHSRGVVNDISPLTKIEPGWGPLQHNSTSLPPLNSKLSPGGPSSTGVNIISITGHFLQSLTIFMPWTFWPHGKNVHSEIKGKCLSVWRHAIRYSLMPSNTIFPRFPHCLLAKIVNEACRVSLLLSWWVRASRVQSAIANVQPTVHPKYQLASPVRLGLHWWKPHAGTMVTGNWRYWSSPK